MGQYYTIVNVTKNEIVDWRDMGGLKLLEHSFVENDVAVWLRHKLARDWTGDEIIHIGDYFDDEKLKSQEYYEQNGKTIEINPSEIDYDVLEYPYILNLDKKEYIDITDIDLSIEEFSSGEFTYDSLLLLIACGNGNNGGDYYIPPTLADDGKVRQYLNQDKVGYWAGDHLAAKDEVKETIGFKKLDVQFNSMIIEKKEK